MLDFIDEEITGDLLFDIVRRAAGRSIYVEEARIFGILDRLEQRMGPARYFKGFRNNLMVLVPKVILLPCVVLALLFVPFVSLGFSMWRLIRRDYGDAGGDIANIAKLNAALDIFYALVLFLSLFAIYWWFLVEDTNNSLYLVASLTNKQRGYEKWIPKVVQMYCKETKRKFNKDGELPNKWNLITYGAGLLRSASGEEDDLLWGARLLDKLICNNKDIISVRQELLSTSTSRSSIIQNLIGMICQAGDSITEKRERAARILAHLASDLHITHFPGTLQCICYLLESCNQFSEPQVTCPLSEKDPDERSRSSQLETSVHQHDAHISVPIIQDKTEDEQEQVDGSSSSARLAQRKQTTLLQRLIKCFLHKLEKHGDRERKQHITDIEEWRRYTYRSRGAKELISQGLLILERLTQDEENCTEIRKHQRLLSKITSTLSSPDFLSNVREDTMVEMLGKSLTVVSRLLTSHGDCTTRLRQELAGNTEAISNLMAILDTDSKGARQLHQQALEILESAFDDSFKKMDFTNLFKALLRIVLQEEASNTTVEEASNTIDDEVEEADRDKTTRLIRAKAGEALARLLLLLAERDANVADILSKQEAIHLLTKVFNQILSSKMGTTTDAVKNAVERSVTEMEDLVSQVSNQKMVEDACPKVVTKMNATVSQVFNFGENARSKAATKTQNLLTEEVINQILCSKRTTVDAAKRDFIRNENLPTEVLDEILSSKMETTVVDILRPLIQEIEKQSEERKFLASILPVAVVICNENVVSKEEFACATPEDEALVEKLKEILKLNKHRTAECFRIVKLTCQVVIAMIQGKPSCIAHFNEHNFEEELTQALKTMLEVDDCMLFAGNDREVIKPARSLASLVKEAQQLLNTTQNHGD